MNFKQGVVYTSRTHGLVEYKGLTTFCGETTLEFHSLTYKMMCFWRPGDLGHHFDKHVLASVSGTACNGAAASTATTTTQAEDALTSINRAIDMISKLPKPEWMLISPDGRLYQGTPDQLLAVLGPHHSMFHLKGHETD